MLSVEGAGAVGQPQAYTTSGRGLNVEELADMAMRKIIYVADTAPPELREQANQFKAQVRQLLVQYMQQAIRSDRTTLYNNLRGAGFPEVANIVLRI